MGETPNTAILAWLNTTPFPVKPNIMLGCAEGTPAVNVPQPSLQCSVILERNGSKLRKLYRIRDRLPKFYLPNVTKYSNFYQDRSKICLSIV